MSSLQFYVCARRIHFQDGSHYQGEGLIFHTKHLRIGITSTRIALTRLVQPLLVAVLSALQDMSGTTEVLSRHAWQLWQGL